ncbi:ubiquitin carboxyl-terminal hydrolase 17-like protein 6 [Calypte anna]|uniref:ubiquitin carboxyl-terminal hydrolase 17-like protein 6 n=1 Tax=Calypte anna TaxID=9244 RepID=UPI0011C34CE6|nr:ubiquitin carboxyl-terminal hydrolase 17-like protein 6 [Calypte anna]
MAPQGNEDKKQRPRVGAGLENMGNTCFLNAVLQCLTYTPSLADYLLSRDHSQSCVRPGNCVMCRVQEHVCKVLHATGSAIVPVDIITALPEIGEHFKLGVQEDAHEFLRCTLDAMQKAHLCDGSLDTSCQHTVIHQIFGSFLRSRVCCLSCQVVFDDYEPFLDILLDIKAAASLSEALDTFVKPELLDARSGFRCRHCGQVTAASKGLTIHWAPQVLTVGLKRFEDVSGGKITKVVKYPKVLDLGPYTTAGEAQHYSLYAVLVHKGESCHSGHYFCYIKANDGLWYKMDDTSVTPCDVDTALQQEAYLLFYVRSSDLRTGARASSSSSAPSRTRSSLGQGVAGSQQRTRARNSSPATRFRPPIPSLLPRPRPPRGPDELPGPPRPGPSGEQPAGRCRPPPVPAAAPAAAGAARTAPDPHAHRSRDPTANNPSSPLAGYIDPGPAPPATTANRHPQHPRPSQSRPARSPSRVRYAQSRPVIAIRPRPAGPRVTAPPRDGAGVPALPAALADPRRTWSTPPLYRP